MPRNTDLRRPGFIHIPKDMDRLSHKVEIIADGTTYDVTNDVLPASGQIDRLATVGLSSFSFNLDNTEGKYKDKFAGRDIVNIYYNFKIKSELATIRFRGLIDSVYNNLTGAEGWFLIIEGRDSPVSSSNEHFADTDISLPFNGRNNLDCWLGVDGTADSKGNYPDGVLYNSGMILKVYDTVDSTWKNYKDLSSGQKDTLKSQTEYTKIHNNTYVDKSRLTMSQTLATEGDYEFRIYYDQDDEEYYFMVHPEEAVLNSTEHVTVGQNFLNLNRYGNDTLEEFNRIKEAGSADGTLLIFRTKQDTIRQSALWIKDKQENNSSMITDSELTDKATARLTELKNGLNKGGLECCALPTLQPGEKIPLNIPYIFTGNIKIKSFMINFGTDLTFNLQLQDRETTFSRLFKDRIDENVNVTSTNNPNGMRNAIVYDFTDVTEYSLTDCELVDDALVLKNGLVSGICVTAKFTADADVTQIELRVKANQNWNSTYKISNDDGVTYNDITISGDIHTFTTTGNEIKLKIFLAETSTGASPQFDKVNLLYK